jgi:hypothetical protein
MTEPSAAAPDPLVRAIAPLEPMNDPAFGAGRDFSVPSSTMLLMFAGMAPWPRVPGWVLFSHTTDLPVKRLFMRDVHSVWYQRGIPGFGETVDDVTAALRSVIDAERIERLVVAGPSAGGYAALLFGTLLEADVVLSFSPQTAMSRETLHELADHRWDEALDRLDRLGGAHPRYTDLRTALPHTRSGNTRCEIHYGASFELDVVHAEHLRGLAGVELQAHEHEGHQLVRALRDSGDLLQILRSALDL